jgi:hypothetical protein
MAKGKRKSKYQPFVQARATALDLKLNSRREYIEWHKETKCQYLPRYPERVYKEWVSWNDFLGTANVFQGDAIQRPVRPMWEAVKFVHELCSLHDINTMEKWFLYYKEHADEIPSDIPIKPDVRYDDFKTIGWRGWLGVDARAKLAAARQSTALFAICSRHNLRMPGNKFALIYAEKGEAEFVSIYNQQRDLELVRCYRIDNELKEKVYELVKIFGKDEGDGYFIPNVNNLLFELDQILDVYTGRQK